MKGIVFNLLEQVVVDEHGEDVWEALLDQAGVSGAYTAVGTYDDSDLVALVNAASAALGLDFDTVVRWFGGRAIPLLAERYPNFFEGHDSTKSFVLTLNDIIHPEVRKLFPGAYAPEFDFEEAPGVDVRLGYRSHRGLCSFAEGLLDGAAAHNGQTARIEQPECTKLGHSRCVFECTFLPGKAAG